MADDNRFTPPGSPVEDVPPKPQGQPPGHVALAVRLLWISLVIGLPILFVPAAESVSASARAAGFMVQLAMFVFAAYLNLCIARRRNWARIVSLVLFLLGLVLMAFAPATVTVTLLEKVINIAGLLLDGAAMYLLFTPPGSSWFEAKPR
ncbi:MAG: hypothetical protein M3Z16_01235 [Pseudomonadota bacterium]|nr:hypothetical protein [Pseudomonadota bacterium]